MRSPIAEPDRRGDTIKITALSREQGNPRLTGDPCIFNSIYGKYISKLISTNYHQQLTQSTSGKKIARNEAIPNGEAEKDQPMSTNTDNEKRQLVTTSDEEQSKGSGFMLKLKWR